MSDKERDRSSSTDDLATTPVVQKSAGKRSLVENRYASSPAVQLHGGNGGLDGEQVHRTADAGLAGASESLPFMDVIQKSFGDHDVSGVRAHTGAEAAAANTQLGATAYARGNDVAFGGSPDLHTAAHEAAHVVQQRAGVSLKGGVGEAGDAYERHADAVADTVVRGGSAEGLLSEMAGGAGANGAAVQSKAVQFIGVPLDQALPEGEKPPEFGEDKGVQRRWSPEQYIAQWEKEQGRKMTARERETIDRGCIGITAQNIAGGGNPLAYAEGIWDNFEQAQQAMQEKNKLLDDAATAGQPVDPTRYILFAKLFWSNQSEDYEERFKPDDDAFKADEHGVVDMTGYKYHAQSRMKKDPVTGEDRRSSYINFDYGFWDDSSNCFWHANHMQYKDPKKRAESPMMVLQSTRAKFTKGYLDFDRIIFCIAKSSNYDPGLAALAHAGTR
ncbi:MAG: DUF4157 domain-containing protein [Deltaproteobacteria bacterium]|nr:DUF4157 domain-containing protein [Kofleriaceae bacterium]